MEKAAVSKNKTFASADAPESSHEEIKPKASHSGSHSYCGSFPHHWHSSTWDDKVSLFGFRRFRTSQLLNLRFLEDEIGDLDRLIFQAGLKLENNGISGKRALAHAALDKDSKPAEGVVTTSNILKLRKLLKEYNEALIAFSSVMHMETVSMGDSDWLTNRQPYLTEKEAYLTRLVRIDLQSTSSDDPLRSRIHLFLRALWFRGRKDRNSDSPGPHLDADGPLQSRKAYQNTTQVAVIVARFLVALLAGILLIIPLVILNHQASAKARLLTVSICIIVFSLLVSFGSRASNQETMVASAGYAAVLVVFVSSSNTPSRT